MITSFHFETIVKLQYRLILKRFLQEMNLKEGIKISRVSFIFCSDNFLLDINNRFLAHNYFTDIITFDFKNDKTGLSEGEIYISVDRVTENSKKFGVKFEDELHRVIFHGTLHLLGYNDKTRAQKGEMKKKEDFYLNKYKQLVSRGT